MSIFITIIGVIVGIVALFLLAAALMKKEYTIKTGIVIGKPKQTVFDYLKILKNQANYSKWVMADPDVRMTYKGTDGTVGFVSAWESDNKQVGKGEQEIMAIADGDRIDCQLRFVKPFENVGNAYFETANSGAGQTQVTWVMFGKNPWPMNFMNLFIPGMLAKDMNESLGNLKTVLEK